MTNRIVGVRHGVERSNGQRILIQDVEVCAVLYEQRKRGSEGRGLYNGCNCGTDLTEYYYKQGSHQEFYFEGYMMSYSTMSSV